MPLQQIFIISSAQLHLQPLRFSSVANNRYAGRGVIYIEAIKKQERTAKRNMDKIQIRQMLVNGFGRFYGEGCRIWSKKMVEGALHATGVLEPLESTFFQSILKELESLGYIKLYYDDTRYLEIFDIDAIQMQEKHKIGTENPDEI